MKRMRSWIFLVALGVAGGYTWAFVEAIFQDLRKKN